MIPLANECKFKNLIPFKRDLYLLTAMRPFYFLIALYLHVSANAK